MSSGNANIHQWEILILDFGSKVRGDVHRLFHYKDMHGSILGKLVHRASVSDSADFQTYREQIDEIDHELMKLLSKRMEIARCIGELKKEKRMAVFQPYRYNEIMERYMKFCADGRIEVDAVREIFELIHSESIRQQLVVMNDNNA